MLRNTRGTGLTHDRLAVGTAKKFDDPAYNVIASTVWGLAGDALETLPLDVLVIDEAGQMSLADAVAAARHARAVICLGDPQQLPQVAQAVHPGGAGASLLEHLLGEHTTVPPDRGVFLAQTRRMHPDVCRFVSEQFYDSRLSAHPDCARQMIEGEGTGLRRVRVEHTGCSTSSLVEAEAVADVVRPLLGRPWTDASGTTRPLQQGDVIVVAAYNDQVRLVSRHLASAGLAEVRVGTVDRFQGREAAVVLFTMAASSVAEIPRGPGFLFDGHRLNVALSRARALFYLVCTDALLDSPASDVATMRLVSTMCAFDEAATTIPDAS